VFAAGLLISLWILAGILIALVVVGGQYLGWGFQLNDPRFLAVMIMIFFVMALNLSGLFEIGTSMTGVGGNLAHKKGYSGSFFSGILTTLVATPCTGPFLGVAMSFALAQPIHISFLVFTALGLGIASPYLLLAFSPKLLNKLPRPGAWMETFKKALAFPLYLAVVYFLNGFGAQTGRGGMVWLLTALVVVAIALWIYGHWSTPGRNKSTRLAGLITALLIGALGIYTTTYAIQRTPAAGGVRGTHLGNFDSTPWEPGIVSKLQKQGHTVFIDYTADT
jgi:thiol:disulfide interchange protein DsbD